MGDIIARCVICDYEAETTEGLSACPKCGTTSLPCDPRQDVTVTINWHELRILGLWAERWANTHPEATPSMHQVVVSITRRLEIQYPHYTPLMISRELQELKKEFPSMETNIPMEDGFDPTAQ